LSVLKIKNGSNWVEIPSLKGSQGPKGDTGDKYILTAQDKEDIRDAVYALIQSAEGGNY